MSLVSVVPPEFISLSPSALKALDLPEDVHVFRGASDEARMVCTCGWESDVYSTSKRKGVDWELAEKHCLDVIEKEFEEVPA